MLNWKRSAAITAALLAAALLAQACGDDGPSGPPPTHALNVKLAGTGAGKVTSEPAGIDCSAAGGACSASFDEGTQVTLTATPAEGMEFVGWSGDGSGTATRTVTMDASRSVTADFDNPSKAVKTVGASGGTIASRDGAVTLEIPEGALSGEVDITIERIDPADLGPEWADLRDAGEIAEAYELGPDGLTFEQPITVSLAPQPVTMHGDSMEVAIEPLATSAGGVVEELDDLTVEVDAEAGTSVMSGRLDHFSPIVRKVRSTTFMLGHVHPEWLVGETDDMTVVVLETALKEYKQEWEASTTGAAKYEESSFTSMYVGATHLFTCVGVGEAILRVRQSLVGTAGGAQHTATFVARIKCVGHMLTVTTSGDGSGTVADDSGKITCRSQGPDCEAVYPPDALVVLAASPDPGSSFEGFSGDGADQTLAGVTTRTITMDGDKSVDAEFGTAPTAELSVSITGEGDATVTSDPAGIECVKKGDEVSGKCAAPFPVGSEVRLTGTTEDGSRLTDWSGDGIVNEEGDFVTIVHLAGLNGYVLTARKVPEGARIIDVYGHGGYWVEAFRVYLELDPIRFRTLYSTMAAAPLAAARGPACPDILVAGRGGAWAIDGCSGDLIRSLSFSDWAFYDAYFLPRPEGATGQHSVLLTGQNYAIFFFDDAGEITSQVGHMHFGTVSDATLIGDDPSAGVALVRNLGGPRNVNFFRFDPELGYFDLHSSVIGATHLPGDAQSAIAGPTPPLSGAPPEEVLVVGVSEGQGVLFHVDMPNDPDEEFPDHTNVGTLGGDNPRRIRCDFESGVCAVSDFANSLITVVLWNGKGMPTIGGVTAPGAVAAGPVGIDVFGHLIVSAGYNDDHYSIIQVDAAGNVVDVTTKPLPEGCTQPGHATFLRDGANTILVSCHGSTAVARIPNAF